MPKSITSYKIIMKNCFIESTFDRNKTFRVYTSSHMLFIFCTITIFTFMIGVCPSNAQSLECSSAYSGVDFVICDSTDLSKLNDRMNRILDARQKQLKRLPSVEFQQEWSSQLPETCGLPRQGKPSDALMREAASCVRIAMEQRIKFLASYDGRSDFLARPKLTIDFGLPDGVSLVALSSDGKLLAAASSATTVAIYNSENMSEVHRFKFDYELFEGEVSAEVHSIYFFGGDKFLYIAEGTVDWKQHIFDVKSGKEIPTYIPGYLYYPYFGDDGNLYFLDEAFQVGDGYRDITDAERLFNLKFPMFKRIIARSFALGKNDKNHGSPNYFNSQAISSDRRLIAYGYSGTNNFHTGFIFDPRSQKIVAEFPNAEFIAFVNNDGPSPWFIIRDATSEGPGLYVIRDLNGKRIASFGPTSGPNVHSGVSNIKIIGDNVCYRDASAYTNELVCYNIIKKQYIFRKPLGNSPKNFVASKDNKDIFVGSDSGSLLRINLASTAVSQLNSPRNRVDNAALSGDGKVAAFAVDNRVHVVSLQTGKAQGSFTISDSPADVRSTYRVIELSHAGETIIIADKDGISAYDTKTGSKKWNTPRTGNFSPIHVEYSISGKKLVSTELLEDRGNWGKMRVRIIDSQNGKIEKTVENANRGALSLDDKTIYFASQQPGAYPYFTISSMPLNGSRRNLMFDKVYTETTLNGDPLYGMMKHSPSKDIFIFDSHIFDVKRRTTIGSLPTGTWVNSIYAFSSDGGMIASSGSDGYVYLTSLSEKTIMTSFNAHDRYVTGLSFSPDRKTLTTVSRDGSAAIWSLPEGVLIARILSFKDGETMTITDEGRYEADHADLRGVSWILPDAPLSPLPVESFMRDFYEPELLPRLLAGKKFKPLKRDLSKLNIVQPSVKIRTIVADPRDPWKVDVAVDVASTWQAIVRGGQTIMTDSGARDLRLFRNGQLVATAPADTDGPIPIGPDGHATITLRDIQLPKSSSAQEVVFTAYAFNDSDVRSAVDIKTYSAPATLAATTRNAYVVTVGISAYESQSWDLSFAVNDARLASKTLIAALQKTGKFSEVIPVELLAEKRPVLGGASKREILDILGRLGGRSDVAPSEVANADRLRRTRSEDLVVLYLAGHGSTDSTGEFFFFPYDIGTGLLSPEIEPSDSVYKKAISSAELSLALRGVDGELVMVLDACQAAASIEGEDFKPGPMSSRGLGQLAYDKAMRVLAATQAANSAYEDPQIGHGYLTYALMEEGLRRGMADFAPRDKKIHLGELLHYGEQRVPDLYKERQAVLKVSRGLPELKPHIPESAMSTIQRPTVFDFARNRDDLVLVAKPSTESSPCCNDEDTSEVLRRGKHLSETLKDLQHQLEELKP